MDERLPTSLTSCIEMLRAANARLRTQRAFGPMPTVLRRRLWKRWAIESLRLRLASKCHDERGCWLFDGAKNYKGYGQLRIGTRALGVIVSAHRASYFAFVGDIAPSMMVCHSCDRPNCVNPSHLYVGTALDNNRDRERRGRRDVKGERHPNAKLTDRDVAVIRRGGKADVQFARELGVDRALVRRVRLKTSWSHRP